MNFASYLQQRPGQPANLGPVPPAAGFGQFLQGRVPPPLPGSFAPASGLPLDTSPDASRFIPSMRPAAAAPPSAPAAPPVSQRFAEFAAKRQADRAGIEAQKRAALAATGKGG